MTSLILASGSASRHAILEGAGIPFEVVRPVVDEAALKREKPDLPPRELALFLAERKALSITAEVPQNALVIGCDQVLEFEGRAYDKPEDRAELAGRLGWMAGRTHYLRGGLVAAKNGEVLDRIEDSAALRMRPLSEIEIDAYLTDAPSWVLGTVGGYALEGVGVRLFERIEGDYFSILGLPLFGLLPVLRREGVLPW